MIETAVPEALLGEQESFVDLLHELTPDDWDRPSLLPGWTVRDVVRHTAFHIHREGRRQSYGSSDKWTAILADRAHADTDEGLVAWFASPVPDSQVDNAVNLDELVIHQQDVRRALGLERDIPEATLRWVLDDMAAWSGSLFVADRPRRLGHGLTLQATDLAWEHGAGPIVAGPGEALLMAIAGRPDAFADLEGDGVAVLTGRYERRRRKS